MNLDEDLLQPALAASAQTPLSFEVAVEDLLPRISAYFRRRIVDGADIDDCAIETVAAMWRRWGEAPEPRPVFEAWAFGIARGVLSNHRRTLKRRHALFRRLADDHAVRPTFSNDEIEHHAVYEALDKLRPLDRELVMLIAWDDLSVQDAGTVVGLAPSAARARYSRARSKLRTMLARADDSDS